MTDNLNTLADCPFCGGEAKSYFNPSCDCCGQISGVAHCRSCPAEVGHYKTEAEAITAWNTRAHPQPTGGVGALVERLTEAEPRFCQLTGKELYAIYPNRDGREAAATILALTAEVGRKDAALRDSVDSCPQCEGTGTYVHKRQTVLCEFCETSRAAIGKAEQ